MNQPNTFFPDALIDEIRENPDNNYFTPVLKEVIATIPRPKEVCDVGCGNGVFSAMVKITTDCRMAGVDGSPYALKQAERFGFDSLHLIEDFSASPLPFADEAFDLVICKDVLEHLLRPDHLVKEISRILRRGGHALIHVPNHFPVAGRFRLLLTNDIDPFGYFPTAKRWEFPHIRFFDKASLIELLDVHQLPLHQDLCHHFVRVPLVSRLVPMKTRHWLADRWSDAFSEGLTVLVRKV